MGNNNIIKKIPSKLLVARLEFENKVKIKFALKPHVMYFYIFIRTKVSKYWLSEILVNRNTSAISCYDIDEIC